MGTHGVCRLNFGGSHRCPPFSSRPGHSQRRRGKPIAARIFARRPARPSRLLSVTPRRPWAFSVAHPKLAWTKFSAPLAGGSSIACQGAHYPHRPSAPGSELPGPAGGRPPSAKALPRLQPGRAGIGIRPATTVTTRVRGARLQQAGALARPASSWQTSLMPTYPSCAIHRESASGRPMQGLAPGRR